jgi:hypothetical protein
LFVCSNSTAIKQRNMGNANGSEGNNAAASASSSEQPEEEFSVSNEFIQSVMTEDGPIVKAVFIKADGDISEIVLDMTPRDRNMDKLLGNSGITIVGGYDDVGAVVLSGRNMLANESSAKLPFPLHECKMKGDICIYRSDDNGIPQDFLLAEYNQLKNRIPTPEEIMKYNTEKVLRSENMMAGSMKQLATLDEEDEDDDEEDEDDEYTAQDAEKDDEDEDEDDDDEEDEVDDEEGNQEMSAKMGVLSQVMEEFFKANGRMPEMEEVKDILRQMNGLNTVVEEEEGEDEDEDEEEDDEDDEDEEEEEEGGADATSFEVLDLLIKEFVEINKRQPTQAEMTQWQEVIGSLDKDSLVIARSEEEEGSSSPPPLETPFKQSASSTSSSSSASKRRAAAASSFASPDTVLMASTPQLQERKRKDLETTVETSSLEGESDSKVKVARVVSA